MSARRVLQILLLACVAAVVAGEFYQYRAFYHDDAYISLRYVHNFLNGDGLVWISGERVEGYSNFLLVIILAALGRLGIDLVFASKLVGVLAYLSLVGFVAVRAFRLSRVSEDDWLWVIPVIITATALPLVIWSLGGLETTLFALLVAVGVSLFADGISDSRRTLISAGLTLGLASLCRPDGLLFVFVGLIVGVAAGFVKSRRFDHRLWGFAAGALALVVPHLIWRWSYYHELVPNTYYIKAANLSDVASYGWSYVKDYSLAAPFLSIVAAAGVIWGVVDRALRAKSVWYLLVLLAYGGYVFSIGGDHMPAFRLLAPVVPLAGWMIFEVIRSSSRAKSKKFGAVAVVLTLLLCASQLLFPAEKYRRAQVMDGAAFMGTQVGKYINEHWPEGSLVALNTAGSTPYCAPKLRFIDMLGLNDTTIARRKDIPIRTEMQKWPGHGKGDGRYILSRRPDYIIIGPSNGDYIADFPWFLSDYELEGSAEFERYYEPVKAAIPARAPGFDHHIETQLGELRFIYYQRRK